MPFFEVIYETGDYSIANYADEAEAIAACEAHHVRAASGAPGGPTGRPAERVVKVLDYGDKHPDDYDPAAEMSGEVMASEVGAVATATDGDAELVAAFTRSLRSPLAQKEHPHDSAYLLKEKKNVKLPFLGGN